MLTGLLPRFSAYSRGTEPESEPVPIGEVQPELPALDRFSARLHERATFALEKKRSGSFKRSVLQLDSEAKEMWLVFANELKAATRHQGCLSHVPAMAARTAARSLRRAGTFHDFQAEQSLLISSQTMRRGIQIAMAELTSWTHMFAPEPDLPLDVQCARAIYKTIFRLAREGRDRIECSWLINRVPKLASYQPNFDLGLNVLVRDRIVAVMPVYNTRKPTWVIWFNLVRLQELGSLD